MRCWVRVHDTQGYSMLSIALSQSQSGLRWPGPPPHVGCLTPLGISQQPGSAPHARLLPCFPAPCGIFPAWGKKSHLGSIHI